MYEYDEECLKTFILNQGQLFDEPVAETLRVKIRTRTKESKRKSRDYFVVSAFFSAFSMA